MHILNYNNNNTITIIIILFGGQNLLISVAVMCTHIHRYLYKKRFILFYTSVSILLQCFLYLSKSKQDNV